MADRETGENTPGGVTARESAGGATMINQRILSQGGGAMTLAVRIISLGHACVTTWMCKPDRTNLSAGRRENPRGTTQKTGDANYHLSPWILDVRSLHRCGRVQ